MARIGLTLSDGASPRYDGRGYETGRYAISEISGGTTMRNDVCERNWISAAAATLLIATAATAQPDWSKLTVLRDIEYVPGEPTRSPT